MLRVYKCRTNHLPALIFFFSIHRSLFYFFQREPKRSRLLCILPPQNFDAILLKCARVAVAQFGLIQVTDCSSTIRPSVGGKHHERRERGPLLGLGVGGAASTTKTMAP